MIKCTWPSSLKITTSVSLNYSYVKVTSLESVVTSLKQENTLLARGINKMVASVQEEKAKNAEVI